MTGQDCGGLERKGRRGGAGTVLRTGPSNNSNGMEHNQTKTEGAKVILLVMSFVFIKNEKTCAR